MSLPIERCYICDDPTGRAGRSDDSLYYEIQHGWTGEDGAIWKPDEIGPLCEACHKHVVEKDQSMEVEDD